MTSEGERSSGSSENNCNILGCYLRLDANRGHLAHGRQDGRRDVTAVWGSHKVKVRLGSPGRHATVRRTSERRRQTSHFRWIERIYRRRGTAIWWKWCSSHLTMTLDYYHYYIIKTTVYYYNNNMLLLYYNNNIVLLYYNNNMLLLYYNNNIV